jgi:hypothetical protein
VSNRMKFEHPADRLKRRRSRREKYVRKTHVNRYLYWLGVAQADADTLAGATARQWLRLNEPLLRDVERIAIDERLGISGVPTNLEFRR